MANSHHRPVGVLLAQLGTPEAPTPAALRPYLKEFLSDLRVVDLNPFLWQPVLRLIVLNTRPARSAALYQRIWLPDGSPLLVHSQAQARGLQGRLGDQFRVILGNRYGQPSIAQAMKTFHDEGIERILVFSMFPQFSSATTASIYDAVSRAALGRRCPLFFERTRFVPTLRYVPPYFDHPAYIHALRQRLLDALGASRPEHFLFSFHGIPQRFADEGDPYPEQCKTTAERLAEALSLKAEQWSISFQSQFGREPWLQPYTEDALRRLGGRNTASLAVTCPGFSADCLETLDEIGHEGAQIYASSGGSGFHLTPCLNDHPAWLDAMTTIVLEETAGWTNRDRPSMTSVATSSP